ncbi:MAG: cell wall hydrolase [Rhizomicrobium sp.]
MVNAITFPAVTGEDIDVLARTVFGEARGESFEGQCAVAQVIVNRAEIAQAYVALHGHAHPRFGNGTIRSACQSAFKGIHQFSCWNDGDPTKARMLAATDADPTFVTAKTVARLVTNGNETNRVDGCTHYFNPAVASPPWAAGKKPFATIGHHQFFNTVN